MSPNLLPSHIDKLDARGGKGDTTWDDGYDHDGVKRVFVRFDEKGIMPITFHYVKGEQEKDLLDRFGSHYLRSGRFIVIDHPDDYLIYVKGWYDSSGVIQEIEFKGRHMNTHQIGKTIEGHDGTEFLLHVQGKKIIGFHGTHGTYLNSIGAYFAPAPPLPAKRLEGHGGDGGSSWDDGAFIGLKKVYVGQAKDGIGMVQFVYDKDGKDDVKGEVHGKRTLMGVEVFELGSGEYITEVHGTYDKLHGHSADVMTMLKFKTNKRTSDPFGLEAGNYDKTFVFKIADHKIVGFHGNASDLIHKIGVHVLPILH